MYIKIWFELVLKVVNIIVKDEKMGLELIIKSFWVVIVVVIIVILFVVLYW